jgi:P pilus assembly chaperone PapD
MVSKTKTKNLILLALISTTFILSVVSYTIQQQAFAQGLFQTQQESLEDRQQQSLTDRNNQTSPLTTTTAADDEIGEEDQKIILGDITIPLNSNTTLSLEMPDSKITVAPN